MRRRPWQTLAWKLTLAFVLVSALTLGAVGVISNVITRTQFNTFIIERIRDDTVTQVQAYVQAHGSVQGFQPTPGGDHHDDRGGDLSSRSRSPAPSGTQRAPYVVLDPQGRTVYATLNTPAGTNLTGAGAAQETPITLNGKTVAFIAPTGIPQQLDQRSQTFLDRTTSALLWAMLAATLAAVLMGLIVSRALLTPVRTLLRGIQQMRRGQAPEAPPTPRADEYGEVLSAFHDMHESVVQSAEARRQLTANIAHDLNTPLSVITGTLEAMLDGTFRTTPERLSRLHREAQHVTSLVGDLRFLALADAGELHLHRQPTDVNQVVLNAVDGVRELARRQDVTLDAHLPPGAVIAPIDARRVTQVMQNLLSNALGYTGAGGRIDVWVRAEGNAVRVSVQDTGTGIAAEKLPFVFDRLYRADEARVEGGSGLGLTICKSIVEGHGGHITIQSVLGQGTTVTFEVPTAQVPVEMA